MLSVRASAPTLARTSARLDPTPRQPTERADIKKRRPAGAARQEETSVATEVKIPDIGDFKDVPIIEVHVKEGDSVNPDDPLVSLESDKATMEVPAPQGGTVERGGHQRDRRLPQGARHRRQGEGLPGHAAGLPHEGPVS